MTKELNPEHAEVARTAWEKIHASIMKCFGGAVIGAASLLDVLGIEGLTIEKEEDEKAS